MTHRTRKIELAIVAIFIFLTHVRREIPNVFLNRFELWILD